MSDYKRKIARSKAKNWSAEAIKGRPIEKVSDPYPLQNRVSLAKAAPEIAAQWHYEKNCGWGPDDFSRGSGINVWWICDKGKDHIWRQAICARTSNGRGCPYCAGQLVSVTNCLARINPKLAKEWHPTKNRVTPKDVTAYSVYIAWWQCKKNSKHVWQAQIGNRSTLGSGCPYCWSETRTPGLTRTPKLLKYFDKERNKGIDPKRLHTQKQYWWKCDVAKDHRWKAGFWGEEAKVVCPFCRGRKPSSTNNLTLRKDLMKDFDPVLNPGLKPKELTLGSVLDITWKCHKCANIWTTAMWSRGIKGFGCRNCATEKRWQEYYRKKKSAR